MLTTSIHSFHIPVMGIGYTIDTPLKVARFGISSVVSIIEDELLDKIRRVYSLKYNRPYQAIGKLDEDSRAQRVTAFLNMTEEIIEEQMNLIKSEPFGEGAESTKYFELLADNHPLKLEFIEVTNESGQNRKLLEEGLRNKMVAGAVEVNIMTKLDKINYASTGEALPNEYCDAMAALRGFAQSKLNGAIVFSAGLNPRLFNYCATFADFFPDSTGRIKKSIILKVGDYRSALIQGKYLAKKGLWVAEFRIESGLNCGGHAFVSDGALLGPILEEFKLKRGDLFNELFEICTQALLIQGKQPLPAQLVQKITAQGGVGTSEEHDFLLSYYGLDSVGWGSPFLLVPEASSIDNSTLNQLANAKQSDYYLSDASPLGVPFNNFRPSTSEGQRQQRIEKNKPGSPCYKKYLSFDTEFTDKPICVASRQYQQLKVKQIKARNLAYEHENEAIKAVTAKECLCEGLVASALLAKELPPEHKLTAVTICPGPNLAYFSGIFTLAQMIDHIYGRSNHLNELPRPHMFINEFVLNVKYFLGLMAKQKEQLNEFKTDYFPKVQENLQLSLQYYHQLLPSLKNYSAEIGKSFESDLRFCNANFIT